MNAISIIQPRARKLCVRSVIFTFAFLIPCTGWAQTRPIFSLATVRSDFREASVVVRMNVTDTKPTERDEHYYHFTAAGQVTESFKGKFKPGQHLEFNVRAELEYRHTDMRGDQIAFLTSFVDRRNGPFQVLPSGNSVEPYTPQLLARVRRVWRESQRSRKRRNLIHNSDAQSKNRD